MKSSGAKDVRRVTLNRFRARYKTAPAFFPRVDCGTFSQLELTRSVFGGRQNSRLGLSYRLAIPVDSVGIQVKSARARSHGVGPGCQGQDVPVHLPGVHRPAEQDVKVL